MLKRFFLKLISWLRIEAPLKFWRSGYLQKVGWLDSFRLKQAIDAEHNPLPWYTYPAIEYIKQFDFSNLEVFEYGSGNSTIFWSQLAIKIVSIENNPQWYKTVAEKVARNVELKLIENKDYYIEELEKYDKFDIIIIDGSYRHECAKVAVKKLKPGGIILLDNADWYVETAKLLRESDLIQVDMTGLGPINPYVWTTSFFLHREFNFKPKTENQPEHGVGALKQYA